MTKRRLVFGYRAFAAFSFAALAFGTMSPVRADVLDGTSALVNGNNRFAFDLYRQSLTAETQNFVYSPYSVSSAFGMLYAGADGSTAEEIARIMQWSLAEQDVHAGLGMLTNDLNSRDSERFNLSVANRLWGQTGASFKTPFLDTLASHYRAPLEELDFVTNSEAGRQRINSWVEQETNRKIVNLLPQGSISSATRLVLTNAVYMKAKWESPFKPESTHTRGFRVTDDDTRDVSMMYRAGTMRYGDYDGYKMVEMPYRDGDVSMIIVLPDEVNGLAGLEASLTADAVQASVDELSYRDVMLHLPKFRIETNLSLNDPLFALGMEQTFGNSDLSRMSDDSLQVSSAIHKAIIEVDEAGTEAAAATAITISITSVWQPPVYEVFRADHPFLFFLRDQRTDSILFMGRLMEPDAANGAPPFGDKDVQLPEPSSALVACLGIASLLAMNKFRRRASIGNAPPPIPPLPWAC